MQVQPPPEQRHGEDPREDDQRAAEHLVGARGRVEEPDVDERRAGGVEEGRGGEGGDGRARRLPAGWGPARGGRGPRRHGAQERVEGQAEGLAREHEGGLERRVVEVDGLVGLGVPADDGGVLLRKRCWEEGEEEEERGGGREWKC